MFKKFIFTSASGSNVNGSDQDDQKKEEPSKLEAFYSVIRDGSLEPLQRFIANETSPDELERMIEAEEGRAFDELPRSESIDYSNIALFVCLVKRATQTFFQITSKKRINQFCLAYSTIFGTTTKLVSLEIEKETAELIGFILNHLIAVLISKVESKEARKSATYSMKTFARLIPQIKDGQFKSELLAKLDAYQAQIIANKKPKGKSSAREVKELVRLISNKQADIFEEILDGASLINHDELMRLLNERFCYILKRQNITIFEIEQYTKGKNPEIKLDELGLFGKLLKKSQSGLYHTAKLYVNLTGFPEKDTSPKYQDHKFTLGDLHGNALKLLYFLIRYGVFKMDRTDYEAFIKIYEKLADELKNSDLDNFNSILSKITVNIDSPKVCLVGDVLADRGSNDYFTLKILGKLTYVKEKDIEILFSNHDYVFLRELELGRKEGYKNFFETGYPFQKLNLSDTVDLIRHQQRSSMRNLFSLCKNGLIQKEEFEILVDSYKKTLKALSYTLNCDGGITISSHAPINLKIIKQLTQEFKVLYKDDTVSDLAQTIDRINNTFKELVAKGKITELVKPENSLDKIIWGRRKTRGSLNPETQNNNYKVGAWS